MNYHLIQHRETKLFLSFNKEKMVDEWQHDKDGASLYTKEQAVVMAHTLNLDNKYYAIIKV